MVIVRCCAVLKGFTIFVGITVLQRASFEVSIFFNLWKCHHWHWSLPTIELNRYSFFWAPRRTNNDTNMCHRLSDELNPIPLACEAEMIPLGQVVWFPEM
uniref:Uncharacterized protein n=1 Tax=Cacopsylla melanoneura TaxID=428564 RepID=A0A8D9F502_9HEMI